MSISISEVIIQLRAFAAEQYVFEANTSLNLLDAVDQPANETALIDAARKMLQKLLIKTEVRRGEVILAEVAYKALLVLADLKPINDIDAISQDKIEKEDRVVVSSGHQFSITNLIEYHNTRGYKDNHLGEFADSKWLLNPLINKSFNKMDVEHIQKVALKRRERLIDNLVYTYDKFDALSLTESVALIDNRTIITNLNRAYWAPVRVNLPPAEEVPNDNANADDIPPLEDAHNPQRFFAQIEEPPQEHNPNQSYSIVGINLE